MRAPRAEGVELELELELALVRGKSAVASRAMEQSWLSWSYSNVHVLYLLYCTVLYLSFACAQVR